MKTPKTNARDRRLKNNAIAALAREKMAHQRDNWLYEGEIRMAEHQIRRAREETALEKTARKKAVEELQWIADGRIDAQDWGRLQEISVQVRVPTRFTVTSFAERGIVSALRHICDSARLEARDLRDLSLGELVKAIPSSVLQQIKYKLIATFSPSDERLGYPITNGAKAEIFDAAVEAIKETASKVDPSRFPIQSR